MGGHATVGRLSNNFYSTFQANKEIFYKKVAERSRDNRRRSRDPWLTVEQLYFDVSAKMEKILKKVAKRSRDSCRRSPDRRPTVKQLVSTFQAIRQNSEKVAERSRDSRRRSRDRLPTVKQLLFDVSGKSETL